MLNFTITIGGRQEKANFCSEKLWFVIKGLNMERKNETKNKQRAKNVDEIGWLQNLPGRQNILTYLFSRNLNQKYLLPLPLQECIMCQ